MYVFIERRVLLHVPFRHTTKEYVMSEYNTVGELKESIREDLDVDRFWSLEVRQDGRELPDDAKFGEANFDLGKPLNLHTK